ncbi:hypothetical protein DV515_00011805, partial [Chloebia gouldiae]
DVFTCQLGKLVDAGMHTGGQGLPVASTLVRAAAASTTRTRPGLRSGKGDTGNGKPHKAALCQKCQKTAHFSPGWAGGQEPGNSQAGDTKDLWS